MLTAPFIVIGILFAVPFISNTGEKESAPPAGRGVKRALYIHSAGCVQLPRHVRALVAKDGSVDQRGHAHQLSGRTFAARTARRPGFSHQAMYQLPQHRRRGRTAWACAR